MKMTTFRSRRYGFEIDIPHYWRSYSYREELIFKSRPMGFLGLFGPDPSHFLTIKLIPFSSTQTITDKDLFYLCLQKGHKNIEIGTIRVDDKYHFWLRYLMGKKMALKSPVGQEMVRKMKLAYYKIIGDLSDDEYLEYCYKDDRGPVVKEYFLVFNHRIYDIIGALGFGTVSEVKETFDDREEIYDEVVSTFRLI